MADDEPAGGIAPVPPIGAVDKALRVLTELAAAGADGLALADLAARVGENKTTIHRTVAALRHRGFATQDPATGHYLLGAAAVGLASQFLRDGNLPQLVHPALVAVCARTDELVHLGVLSGVDVVYLDKVEPDRAIRVRSSVGRRMPAATTALGRALIAYTHPRRESIPWYTSPLAGPESGLRGADLEERTWDAVRTARERGYATEDQENEPGISCVAFPILHGDTAVAALSITAPSERMDAARVRQLIEIATTTLPATLPSTLALPAIAS